MENENFVTAGATGLAMEVGRQRSEIDRLRDDMNRDLAAVRTEIADLRSERETRERVIFDTVAALIDRLEEVTTTVKPSGPAGQKPTATEDEDPAPPPMRNAGERPADYHKRVAAWARDIGKEEPPKPPTGPVANNGNYAAKVARFYRNRLVGKRNGAAGDGNPWRRWSHRGMSMNHRNHRSHNTAPRARQPRVTIRPETMRPASHDEASNRIYVASPISTYQTDRYDVMVSRVRCHFTDPDILPARDLSASNADWRRRWPVILPTLDAVVFFDDDDGCIGAGTEQELVDAQSAGLPVFFLTPAPYDRLIPCDASGAVEFWPVIGGGMRQTLRVCYAVPVDEALALLSAHGIGDA